VSSNSATKTASPAAKPAAAAAAADAAEVTHTLLYAQFTGQNSSVVDPDSHGSALIWLSWIRMRIRIQ
jgi:hypothetical protein